MIRKCIALLFSFALSVLLISPASAHPGRTDGNGGHYNRSTGEYHYHHGYPEHQHTNGTCPYDFDDKTGENSGTSGSSNSSKYDDPPIQIQKKEKITWDNISNFLYWLFISPFLIAPVFFWILSLIPDNPKNYSASQQTSPPSNSMSSPETHQPEPEPNYSESSQTPLAAAFNPARIWTVIDTPLIFCIGYDPDSRSLIIRLSSSYEFLTFVYQDVPRSVYDKVLQSSDPDFYYKLFIAPTYHYWAAFDSAFVDIPSPQASPSSASYHQEPPPKPQPEPPEPCEPDPPPKPKVIKQAPPQSVPPAPSVSAPPRGGRLLWNPSTSSVISHWAYDSDRIRLYVRMRNSGTVYVYYNVPDEVEYELSTASSIGRYYNAFIKGNYRSRNLGYKAPPDDPPRS